MTIPHQIVVSRSGGSKPYKITTIWVKKVIISLDEIVIIRAKQFTEAITTNLNRRNF
jgi:hypothetical protein